MSKKEETIYNVYMYIRGFIMENGYSPTYNQISSAVDCSKGAVYNAVNYLIDRYYLKRPKWGVLQLTERMYKDE